MAQKKKYVILVGDGMGDYPLAELGGMTPLQFASIPNIRAAATAGEARLVKTVPDGMTPGSDVANLSIMGFDPARYYTGRAPIEAAGAGIAMTPEDVAFRCNLITVAGGAIADHSSGHITTPEANLLMDAVEKKLGRDGRHFFPGTSYRHLLIWRRGPLAGLATTPPHDVLGQPALKHAPRGLRADEIIGLMEDSKQILAGHPVNRRRREEGRREATQIWLWGQGKSTSLPPYREIFGLTGGVVTAVDLVRGIGRLAGLEAGTVKGATGFIDTDYAAKVKAALAILEKKDFVFVHVEAPDECSHNGDLKLKLRAIEDFDRNIVGPVSAALAESGWQYRLIIGTDHRTPVSIRNHTAEPVPMAVVDGPFSPSKAAAGRFDEFINGGKSSGMAYEWLQALLGNKPAAAVSGQG